MFRSALRTASAAKLAAKAPAGRRFASTASSRSGTWTGAGIRWGLAGAIVYYYNTSTALAEETAFAPYAPPPEKSNESEIYPTVDSIANQRRAQARPNTHEQTSTSSAAVSEGEVAGALEEEAEQQGAFNEETGEINWECPCLGGMAHGPCGDQFRAAFSCFVFSKDEPKGVDCIEHFKTMQNCFREHPDIYGSELDDDEAPSPVNAEGQAAGTSISSDSESSPAPKANAVASPTQETEGSTPRERSRAAKAQVERDFPEHANETEQAIPKAWHDSRESNNEK